MPKKVKTGLVVEGGGMKCAYSAGILDRFLDEGISFDYCIGVSAGCANIASYLAGQRERNLRFYTEHLKDPRYFGAKSLLKTGDLFGLDYIYSTLTNSDGKDALGFQEILRNPAEFEIVATNARTARPVYFNAKKMTQDHYDIIKASCTLPGACHARKVNDTPFFDGGVSDSIPCDRAFDKGCDKLVVILSKPRDFVKKPETMRWFYTMRCAPYPNIVRALNRRHITYTAALRHVFELEQDGKAFIFAPGKYLTMGLAEMDPGANQALYDLAITEFDENKEALRQFLNGI